MYSLPKNSKLEAVSALQSGVDIVQLQQHMAKSIASILGVPFEIIGGVVPKPLLYFQTEKPQILMHVTVAGGYTATEGNKKSLENGRVFISNMGNLCTHLQHLLEQVYQASFPNSKLPLTFRLRASPRMEINTIEVFSLGPETLSSALVYYLTDEFLQEFVLLLNTGLVTTQNAFMMTNMILGLDFKHAGVQVKDHYKLSEQYIPPALRPNNVAQNAKS